MRFFVLSIFLLFFMVNINAQQQETLIQKVNYIDVNTGEINVGDILIEGERIKKIASKIRAKKTMTLVDGNGKWLIPGLVDAHIHLFQSGGLYTRPDAIALSHIRSYEEERKWLVDNAGDLLQRYLKCGITTVIDVGGPMYNYKIRDQYKGSNQHPNVFLTGPLISTYQPKAFDIEEPPIIKIKTAEEARELVRKQLPYQPDFIKIWYITLRTQTAESNYEIVKATIEESHKNNLLVAVHATQLNTAKLAIKAGADILVHSVETEVDDDFLRMVKENNVIYIPTLVVHGNYYQVFSQQFSPSKEDLAISSPIPLGSLFDTKHLQEEQEIIEYLDYTPRMKTNLAKQNPARNKNLKTLTDAGVVVSTGTDAGNIGTLHASSYYQELDEMKKSGLTNQQILKASTINGAKTLGKDKELGSIETGKIADLVLLNQNPIADLDALKDIHTVIKSGHLMSPDTIIQSTPEQLAQEQLNAYNAGDIDAFLEPYSDDVEIYNFPDKLTAKGKEVIRPNYASMFEKLPELHCELVNRIVMGNTVIDQERVTGFANRDTMHCTAIYKIEDGKIAKVYFIYK